MKKLLLIFLLILSGINVLSQEKSKLMTVILDGNFEYENGLTISPIETYLFDDKTYLFHLNMPHYGYRLKDKWIEEKFVKQQKIINYSYIGKEFYYILYKLGFLNSLVKIYCSRWNLCTGFMFFDPEGKRLLILHSECTKKLGEDDYDKYAHLFIETLDCTGIEYFDLNKGIYEFAGFLPAINIRQNKILVIAKVKKGLFPGIDKDYTFQRELSLTKKEQEYIGIENDYFYTPYGMEKELERVNKESLKEYEKMKKKYLKSGEIEELITSDMEDQKMMEEINRKYKKKK